MKDLRQSHPDGIRVEEEGSAQYPSLLYDTHGQQELLKEMAMPISAKNIAIRRIRFGNDTKQYFHQSQKSVENLPSPVGNKQFQQPQYGSTLSQMGVLGLSPSCGMKEHQERIYPAFISTSGRSKHNFIRGSQNRIPSGSKSAQKFYPKSPSQQYMQNLPRGSKQIQGFPSELPLPKQRRQAGPPVKDLIERKKNNSMPVSPKAAADNVNDYMAYVRDKDSRRKDLFVNRIPALVHNNFGPNYTTTLDSSRGGFHHLEAKPRSSQRIGSQLDDKSYSNTVQRKLYSALKLNGPVDTNPQLNSELVQQSELKVTRTKSTELRMKLKSTKGVDDYITPREAKIQKAKGRCEDKMIGKVLDIKAKEQEQFQPQMKSINQPKLSPCSVKLQQERDIAKNVSSLDLKWDKHHLEKIQIQKELERDVNVILQPSNEFSFFDPSKCCALANYGIINSKVTQTMVRLDLYPIMYTLYTPNEEKNKDVKSNLQKEEYFIMKSQIHLNKGEYEKAEDFLIHGLRIMPGHNQFLFNLALVLFYQQKFKEAADIFHSLIENTQANNLLVMYNYYITQIFGGRFEKALQYETMIGELIEKFPDLQIKFMLLIALCKILIGLTASDQAINISKDEIMNFVQNQKFSRPMIQSSVSKSDQTPTSRLSPTKARNPTGIIKLDSFTKNTIKGSKKKPVFSPQSKEIKEKIATSEYAQSYMKQKLDQLSRTSMSFKNHDPIDGEQVDSVMLIKAQNQPRKEKISFMTAKTKQIQKEQSQKRNKFYALLDQHKTTVSQEIALVGEEFTQAERPSDAIHKLGKFDEKGEKIDVDVALNVLGELEDDVKRGHKGPKVKDAIEEAYDRLIKEIQEFVQNGYLEAIVNENGEVTRECLSKNKSTQDLTEIDSRPAMKRAMTVLATSFNSKTIKKLRQNQGSISRDELSKVVSKKTISELMEESLLTEDMLEEDEKLEEEIIRQSRESKVAEDIIQPQTEPNGLDRAWKIINENKDLSKFIENDDFLNILGLTAMKFEEHLTKKPDIIGSILYPDGITPSIRDKFKEETEHFLNYIFYDYLFKYLTIPDTEIVQIGRDSLKKGNERIWEYLYWLNETITFKLTTFEDIYQDSGYFQFPIQSVKQENLPDEIAEDSLENLDESTLNEQLESMSKAKSAQPPEQILELAATNKYQSEVLECKINLNDPSVQPSTQQEIEEKQEGDESETDSSRTDKPASQKDQQDIPFEEMYPKRDDMFIRKLLEKIVTTDAENVTNKTLLYELAQRVNTFALLERYIRKNLKKVVHNYKNVHDYEHEDIDLSQSLSVKDTEKLKKQIHQYNLSLEESEESGSDSQGETLLEKITSSLIKLKFFSRFTSSALKRIIPFIKFQSYQQGRTHSIRDLESNIMIVAQGRLKVADINQNVLKIINKGECFSEASFYSKFLGQYQPLDDYWLPDERIVYIDVAQPFKSSVLITIDRDQFMQTLFEDKRKNFFDKINFMNSAEFFKEISPYANFFFSSYFEIRTYMYGEVVVKQSKLIINPKLGDIPKECYIVLEGECKVVYEDIMLRSKLISKYAKKCIRTNVSQPLRFGLLDYQNPVDNNDSDADSDESGIMPNEDDDIINKKLIVDKLSFQNDIFEFYLKKDGEGYNKLQKDEVKNYLAFNHHVSLIQ